MSAELASLVKMNAAFTAKFGPKWYELEDETLSMELKIVFSETFLNKVILLRVLLKDAESFEDKLEQLDQGTRGYLGLDEPRIESDALFFIHACDIANNIPVEPGAIAMPSLFQLAYAVDQFKRLPINFNPEQSEMITLFTEGVLKQEGLDRAIEPFTYVPDSAFPVKTRTAEEISATKVSIAEYFKYMDSQT